MNSTPSDAPVSVEFDPETDSYRAHFDSGTVDASVAVVELLAAATDAESTTLDPLSDVVNPDALDTLCRRGSRGQREGDRRVAFSYAGYRVTVKSYGVVQASPLSDDEE